jgi:chromatin remodeling complex protein RSC6
MPSTKPVRNTLKKTTNTKTKKVIVKKQPTPAPVVEEPVAIVEEPLVEEPLVEESPVLLEEQCPVEEIVSPVEETNNVTEEKTFVVEKKSKNKIDKETYLKRWDDLFELYADVLKTRKQPHQNVSLFNYLKSLKTDTQKLLRIRNTNNTNKTTSGFMKPVNISDELRKFINLNDQEKEEPITRVLITQKLCQYIKEKNLQKPEDKREILPDADMKKLFDITADETEKLTYYSMQKKIQAHIFKI